MLLRSLLIMVNLTTIVAAIVVLHDFPQYAGAAFYVLVGWMVGSLVLLYGPWANRPLNSFRTGAATSGHARDRAAALRGGAVRHPVLHLLRRSAPPPRPGVPRVRPPDAVPVVGGPRVTSPSPIVRLPLPAMTAVIGGLTVVALLLAVRLDWGIWRYAFFAIPAVVAVYYLNEYPETALRTVPLLPAATDHGRDADGRAHSDGECGARSAEEPFEDPVEEADRIAAETATRPTPEGEASPETTPSAPEP